MLRETLPVRQQPIASFRPLRGGHIVTGFWLQLVSNSLLTGLVVALVNAYFKSREPFVALEAKRRDDHLREEARAHSECLRPLGSAAHDLIDRLRWYHEALDAQASAEMKKRIDHLRRSVKRLKDEQDRSQAEAYMLFCNGEGVDGADAMYVFARYFALATKTRDVLPTIEWALDRSCEDLRHTLIKTENALNQDGFGIYETVQRSIGQYMLGADGKPKPYPSFCELLAGRTTYPHFLVLFDFLIQLPDKRDYQLAAALRALPAVETAAMTLSDNRSLLRS
jgi:hypothetical protein